LTYSIGQLVGNDQVGQDGRDLEDSDNSSDDDEDDSEDEDSDNNSGKNIRRYVPESDDEDEYYTASIIADSVAPDLLDSDIDAAELDMDLDNEAQPSWGARVRPCLTTLDKIHKHKIQAGQAPAWLFADYLEFEFVKWMVDHDISQGARDKLIKLPIVSRSYLDTQNCQKLTTLKQMINTRLPSAQAYLLGVIMR
jgi:hypothetical protein